MICIICPNGCPLRAEYEEDNGSRKILAVEGNLCPRGEAYARQELTDPRRTISSSVTVRNGELPLASVRLTAPIPKDRIFEAMEVIRGLSVEAPAKAGTVLVHNLFGCECDIIVTKNVERRTASDEK